MNTEQIIWLYFLYMIPCLHTPSRSEICISVQSVGVMAFFLNSSALPCIKMLMQPQLVCLRRDLQLSFHNAQQLRGDKGLWTSFRICGSSYIVLCKFLENSVQSFSHGTEVIKCHDHRTDLLHIFHLKNPSLTSVCFL